MDLIFEMPILFDKIPYGKISAVTRHTLQTTR